MIRSDHVRSVAVCKADEVLGLLACLPVSACSGGASDPLAFGGPEPGFEAEVAAGLVGNTAGGLISNDRASLNGSAIAPVGLADTAPLAGAAPITGTSPFRLAALATEPLQGALVYLSDTKERLFLHLDTGAILATTSDIEGGFAFARAPVSESVVVNAVLQGNRRMVGLAEFWQSLDAEARRPAYMLCSRHMRRTMIYLEAEQHRRLEALARRRKGSVAALIRMAVDDLLGRASDHVALSFVGSGAGPRGGDVSTRPHEAVKQLLSDRARESEA